MFSILTSLMIFMAGFSAPSAVGPSQAVGSVFLDGNGNGLRDAGERGLEGVRVSNGLEVVKTDGTGAWRLPAFEGAIFFVIKPTGYMVPLSADNLPRHFYIHDPDGTPAELGLRFPGIDPTGPLPASIDFALIAVDEPADFDALLFADTQPQTRLEVDYIRDDIVEEVISSGAAWGITAGDVMFDDMSLFPRYNRVMGRIGTPWWNVPGNHELNFLSPDDRYSLETFKRYFGPAYYSFDYADIHVIVLDNVHYFGKDAKRDKPDPRNTGAYEGRISAEQLKWLKADLAHVPADQQILLFGHIPLVLPLRETEPGVNVLNRRELFALFKGHPKVISFAGHTHTNYHLYFGRDEGWPHDEPLHHHTLATVSGAWWGGPKDERGVPSALQTDGVPNGYSILSVRNGEVSVRYKGAGLSPAKQMRILVDADFHNFRIDGLKDSAAGRLLEGAVTREHLAAARVIVNVFNASARSKVELSVDGGAFEAMTQVTAPDPMAREFFLRNADTKKSWTEASPTDHLWTSPLPRSLSPGAHTLRVRAEDAYGAIHEDAMVLEVVDGGGGG